MTQPIIKEIEANDQFKQAPQGVSQMTDFISALPLALDFIHETTGQRRMVDVGNVSREQAYILSAQHREAGEVLLQVVEQ